MAKADSKVDDTEKDVEEVDEETQDELEDDETEDNEEEIEEESDEEDSDDEEETNSEDEEEKFKKRYTQIKGDSPEEYIPNLEEAYKNSSAEGVRLKQKVEDLQKQVDNISSLVANNPEHAEQIQEGKVSIPTDPALLRARQDMEAQNKKEYTDFVDAHPELENDAELQKQVFDEIRDFAEVAAKKNRVLGMKEALNMAYTSLGLQTQSKEETIRMKAKETAARGKSAGTAKKAKAKIEFTEAQINAGIQMGLGKTRQEVIKKLATYA